MREYDFIYQQRKLTKATPPFSESHPDERSSAEVYKEINEDLTDDVEIPESDPDRMRLPKSSTTSSFEEMSSSAGSSRPKFELSVYFGILVERDWFEGIALSWLLSIPSFPVAVSIHVFRIAGFEIATVFSPSTSSWINLDTKSFMEIFGGVIFLRQTDCSVFNSGSRNFLGSILSVFPTITSPESSESVINIGARDFLNPGSGTMSCEKKDEGKILVTGGVSMGEDINPVERSDSVLENGPSSVIPEFSSSTDLLTAGRPEEKASLVDLLL
jgi:hypothetical protein